MPVPSAKVLRWVCGLSLLLLALTAGGELYLRRAIHPPPAADRFLYAHPPLAELRVSIRPGLSRLPPKEVAFTTNALGLRGDDLDLSDHTRLRILTLGDSVTECMLLSDGEAWPRQLQDELARRLGRPVWVGNAAKSGEMIADFAAHMRLLVPLIAPDLVVIVAGGHDFQSALEQGLIPVTFEQPGQLASFRRNLYAHQNVEPLGPSYLLSLWLHGERLQRLDMTDFYLRMRARRASLPKVPELPDLEDALDVYTTNLRALIAGYRALPERTALLLTTHPSLWRPDMSAQELAVLWAGYTCMDCKDPSYYHHAALARGIRAWNEALLATCRAAALPCLDLDAIVDKSLENFYDDAHMGELGARRTAGAIAEFVAQKGLLP